MEKTPFLPPERLRSILPWAGNLLFYGTICWAIAASELPSVKGPVFLMKKQLLAGNEALFGLQDPGLPFAIFGSYLPQKGRASFLTDIPYDPQNKNIEYLQAAQGRLTPLLLNTAPDEKTAIVFCSQNSVATARMQATGYHPVKILGDGKMIAEKTA